MKIQQIIIYAIAAIALSVLIASCRNTASVATQRMPAGALQAGSSVYAQFIQVLKKSPTDNDFSRFASDPSNYDVTVLVNSDHYVYTFSMKPYRGRDVLDGRLFFEASKDGSSVMQTAKP